MGELKFVRLDNTSIKHLSRIRRFNLLKFDDIGLNPFSSDDANDLFEIIKGRVLVSATIVSNIIVAN